MFMAIQWTNIHVEHSGSYPVLLIALVLLRWQVQEMRVLRGKQKKRQPSQTCLGNRSANGENTTAFRSCLPGERTATISAPPDGSAEFSDSTRSPVSASGRR
jgi:hypothetical protein